MRLIDRRDHCFSLLQEWSIVIVSSDNWCHESKSNAKRWRSQLLVYETNKLELYKQFCRSKQSILLVGCHWFNWLVWQHTVPFVEGFKRFDYQFPGKWFLFERRWRSCQNKSSWYTPFLCSIFIFEMSIIIFFLSWNQSLSQGYRMDVLCVNWHSNC